jgi:hypothetical protein
MNFACITSDDDHDINEASCASPLLKGDIEVHSPTLPCFVLG